MNSLTQYTRVFKGTLTLRIVEIHSHFFLLAVMKWTEFMKNHSIASVVTDAFTHNVPPLCLA